MSWCVSVIIILLSDICSEGETVDVNTTNTDIHILFNFQRK